MVIRIFYAVCGLSLLFFGAFFLQCCRSASRKNKYVIGELSISDIFASAQTTRQLARWEKEMAEFMARQVRSKAPLFLNAASSAALPSSTIPPEHSDSNITQVNQRTPFLPGQPASPGHSRAGQTPCKKN